MRKRDIEFLFDIGGQFSRIDQLSQDPTVKRAVLNRPRRDDTPDSLGGIDEEVAKTSSLTGVRFISRSLFTMRRSASAARMMAFVGSFSSISLNVSKRREVME